MPKRFEHWFSWPSWIISRLLLFLAPGKHPWRQRKKFFTLREWHAGQTDFARQADVVFGLGMAMALYQLVKWAAGL